MHNSGCFQVVVRVRPMNERELFTSDATAVQVDEQDPQQMQVSQSLLSRHIGRINPCSETQMELQRTDVKTPTPV